MPQFRLRGISPQGKIIQSEFEADNKKSAKAKVDKITRAKGIKIQALEQKEKYHYKVRKSGKQIIKGEQEAYSKEEVEKALIKLGYNIVRVEKELIKFNVGVPTKEVVTFIRLSADLLKQKLSFDQILDLLYEDTANKQMKETIKQIQKDLKEGKEGSEVYSRHKNVFGRFASYMLGVASTSGNMSQVFESTAKFLERNAEFKKNLRKSLMMPTITVLAVIGVVLFYVGYIFPKTAEMFQKLNVTLPPMTAETLIISHYLQSNWIGITLSIIFPIAAFLTFIKTPSGRLWLDKTIIKIPVIGDLIHKTSLEIFSRVFFTLYSGAGQNIEVIRVAAEACRNSYIEQQIKLVAIKNMLKGGMGLVEALEETGVFTRTALSRFRLGAESGALRENAKQLADYYEIQTTYKLEAAIDLINLFVNIFIMIALVGITIVSSETAIIQPHVPGT
jgi:type IV pilus assembly protein PilC